MLTIKDYLMGRAELYSLSDEMQEDAMTTVSRVNALLKAFGEDREVNSGYRPPDFNATVPGAAPHSNHTLCRACDLEDKDGRLDAFCMENQEMLESIGLWLESPNSTPHWCHVQIVPPGSGHRVFMP